MSQRPNALELLAAASSTLFSSLSYDETLAALARLLVPSLAEWCVVDVIEHGALRRVKVAHALPEMEDLARETDRRYPPRFDASAGAGKAVRTLLPEVVNEITDEMLQAAAQDEEHYRLLKQTDLFAFLCVPMVMNGIALGAISLIRNSQEGLFTAADVQLAQELAVRAAIAVNNAQVTQELNIQAQRFKLAHEAARMGAWYLDLRSPQSNYWSPELYEIAGFPRDWRPEYGEWLARINEAERAHVDRDITAAITAGGSFKVEYRLLGFDGVERWHESRGAVIAGPEQKPIAAAGITLDITERKALEARLQSSELRLRLAQRAARIGTWEIDLASGRVFWSDELYDVIGFDRKMAPDFSLYMNRIHPDDQGAVNRRFQEQLTANVDDVGFEYRMIGMDGETRWIATRGRIMRDSEGRPQTMVGILMDVTERKLAEEALRESERMAAAGRLAATLAHEINNPLAAITNLVYLARQSSASGESGRYLDMAEQELRRVSRVTAQTLRYYRNDSGEAGSNIGDAVNSALMVLKRKIEAKRIEVKVEVELNASVNCNESDCRQILLNLLGNAVDAVEDGGTISVRAYSRDRDLRLIISDDGLGVAEQLLPRLFQPFVTSKGASGTGLGLWITRGLVEKNGGSIRLRSSRKRSRRGTTLLINLPQKSVSTAPANAQKVGVQI